MEMLLSKSEFLIGLVHKVIPRECPTTVRVRWGRVRLKKLAEYVLLQICMLGLRGKSKLL